MEVSAARRLLPWVAGAVIALVLIGPGFDGRAWINLDQSVVPHASVPHVLLGLGPDVPRRAPFTLVAALGSPWALSAWITKAVIVALFATGCAGMAGLLRRSGTLVATGAGMLYVGAPFVVGRMAAGHLGIVWCAALLPWALGALSEASDDAGRAFRWSLALGLGGYLAGTIMLAFVPVLAVATWAGRARLRDWLTGLGAVLAGQAIWAVPGTAVAASVGFGQPGAAGFGTRLAWPSAPLRLAIGEGFFHDEAGAVPFPGPWGAVAGAVVLGLAVAGVVAARRGPSEERGLRPGHLVGTPAGSVALGVGLVVPLLGTVPWVADRWATLTGVQPFNLVRESHRVFLIAWVVIVPAAALGLTAIGRRVEWLEPVTSATIGVVALLLLAPQAWAWGANSSASTCRAGKRFAGRFGPREARSLRHRSGRTRCTRWPRSIAPTTLGPSTWVSTRW